MGEYRAYDGVGQLAEIGGKCDEKTCGESHLKVFK